MEFEWILLRFKLILISFIHYIIHLDLYDGIFKAAENVVTKPDLDVLKFSLSIRNFSPKVQLHYQVIVNKIKNIVKLLKCWFQGFSTLTRFK